MLSEIDRVVECWRRLYWRNWKWVSREHEGVYIRLTQLRPRVAAGTPCAGCDELVGMAMQFGDSGRLVCEACLIHALAYLCDGSEAGDLQRELVLGLLLGETK